jgi:hypothetical protein
MSAAGSQMRVVPEGLRTSTRVVTSKVRHWSIVASGEASLAKNRPGFANARLAEKIPVERRKSRPFQSGILPSVHDGCETRNGCANGG